MAFRGRGRGRGFGFDRGFQDRMGMRPIGENLLQLNTPYPKLEYPCAMLSLHEDYAKMMDLNKQLCTRFQNSDRFLRVDVTEIPKFNKDLLSLDWNSLPLELRPTAKRKLPSEPGPKNNVAAIDMKIFDELEQIEKTEVATPKTVSDNEQTMKKEKDQEEAQEDEEVAEFEDEELDFDNDYDMNYFDNGEDYLDEDNDGDDGPYF